MASQWEIETADFRCTPAELTVHDGKPYLIRSCEELVAGRWEDFVSMIPVEEAQWRITSLATSSR